MLTETALRRGALISLTISLLIILVGGAVLLRDADDLMLRSKANAQAPAPETKVVHLPPGQKLEGVSWACHAAGHCSPAWLTRPMRPDETPETHTLRNDAGFPTVVLTEHLEPS